jgi:hypothetical protein
METESAKPDRIRVGFAVTGSFCTFSKVIPQIDALNKAGYEVVPIMSETAYSSDTRFGTAADFRERISSAAGNKKIIHSIQEAEPIGLKSSSTYSCSRPAPATLWASSLTASTTPASQWPLKRTCETADRFS